MVWCVTYGGGGGGGGNHYGITVLTGTAESDVRHLPVINNKALVAAVFHPGQESVKTGETMPGVMYQVSKLLYLFFFL